MKQNFRAFQLRHSSTVCRLLNLQPYAIRAIIPCTPLQQGIISRSLNNSAGLYFEEFCLQLSTNTDLGRLKLAWTKVVSTTDVLRMRFCSTTDGHAQVVLQNSQLPWSQKGFETEEDLQAYKKETLADWRNSNSELTDRLFEICVLYTPTKRLLYLRLFHALYDGMSLPMMLEDVIREYNQTPKPKPRPSYIEALAVGPLCEIEEAKIFWAQRFINLTYRSELPTQGPLSTKANFSTLNISHLNLNEARRHHNTTYQSLVQAAWMLVLRKFFPSETVFGTVVSGRSIDFEDIDQVIGPLFNTLPFYVDTRNCKSWGDIIGRCHDFNIAVTPYQHSSLRDIMKWAPRSLKQSPFETLFVFQKETLSTPITDCSIWTQMDTIPQVDVCSISVKSGDFMLISPSIYFHLKRYYRATKKTFNSVLLREISF